MSPIIRHAIVSLTVHAASIGSAIACGAQFTYWHGAAFYWFCVIVFLFVYSAVYKSVSLRVLLRLSQPNGNSVTFDEISRQLIRPRFEERATILVEAGHVEFRQGHFEVTEKGRGMAARFRRVRRLLGIENAGLYSGR